ncbi:MAG: xanthine dehydrogenase family protein molybdopterin-binding subunit [Acidimicrobiia bacterium]
MQGSILGAAVKRAEDPRFITGQGRYLDDMNVEGALWAVMVRSSVPHATLTGIDTSEAASMEGVVGVYTAPDLELGPMNIAARGLTDETRRPLLASDRVRFVGDLVAVVVAESRPAAFDAAELVWPDYELLTAVATTDQAMEEGAPLLFPELGTNLVLEGGLDTGGDVLEGADVVVSVELENQRLAAVPLEPNNALAVPRSDGGVDVWLGSQGVHGARYEISKVLGIDRELLHVKVPDMGGGFGAKINAYPEQVLVVALAMKLGRPVRWQEHRTENLLSMSHGRAQHQVVELGARSDGTITGLRWRVTQDGGAYPLFGSYLAHFTQRMASGAYRIPAVDFRWQAVVTNTTPVDAYRGAGRPEAAMTIERLVDLLAAELQIDPAEIRRRNFIPPGEFPYLTGTGERYDSGDYEAALDLALEKADYHRLRAEQARRRASMDRFQIGIGISSYVEVTAPGGRKDWGKVEVTPDEVVVYSGASSHGHGHETSFVQIASGLLKVPFDRIRFVQGDTDLIASGGGTMGSRSLQMAGSAIHRSSVGVVEKARRIFARAREAALDDVVQFEDGRIGVTGVPDSGVDLFAIARMTQEDGDPAPDEDPGLVVEDRWAQEEATVPFGTHISVVEVDIETGDVRVLRHVACDDCGTILNRIIVDGQVEGGVAQGMGQALWEQFRYDDDANPITSNLTTYLVPSATVVPMMEVDHTQTTTDQNPLGAKGIGEAGTIGSTPAVANAVHDALRPFGIRHLDMPLTPSKIWTALQGQHRE